MHSESTGAGHGPGVVTLMSGPIDRLRIRRDPSANIATILGIRRAAQPLSKTWLPDRHAHEQQREAQRQRKLQEVAT